MSRRGADECIRLSWIGKANGNFELVLDGRFVQGAETTPYGEDEIQFREYRLPTARGALDAEYYVEVRAVEGEQSLRFTDIRVITSLRT